MDILSQAFAGLKLQDQANADAVADLLDRFDLRWTVSKQPLFLQGGSETQFFGIVRDDNQTVFTTCKEGYVPFQNSELAELLIRISDKSGYKIHKGGMFNDGGKVYLQLDTDNHIKGIGKNADQVDGYATGINSHDGTGSLRWGASNITISCKNTFAAAGKQLQNRVRHTASIHDRVDFYLREVEGVVEHEKAIFDRFIHLSEIPVTKKHILSVAKIVSGVDLDNQNKDSYSSQAIGKAEKLAASIGSEMAQKGDTLWGLFSGVTHFTSHVMAAPKRDNGRLESKYTGTGLDIDNKIFSTLCGHLR